MCRASSPIGTRRIVRSPTVSGGDSMLSAAMASSLLLFSESELPLAQAMIQVL
jgi:hypothetical protein